MATEEGISGGWSVELWLAERDDGPESTELRQRVWDELSVEELVQEGDLSVEVVECTAILNGTVTHYPAKLAAERAARRAVGVRAVENRIRVVPFTTHVHDDAELWAAAVQALDWSALVPHDGITLSVMAGVVTLEGEVRREYERLAAAELIGGLDGVTDVRNEIRLRSGAIPPRRDERIRGAVRHEGAPHVSADINGDTVVLRGRVRSLAQRDALERAVKSVSGVAEVRDEVDVERV